MIDCYREPWLLKQFQPALLVANPGDDAIGRADLDEVMIVFEAQVRSVGASRSNTRERREANANEQNAQFHNLADD